MASTRRNVVRTRISDGVAELDIYTAPDAHGLQGVAETVKFAADEIHDALFGNLALAGFIDKFSQVYGKLDNPGASEVRAAFDEFAASIRDGTWTPGRQFEAAEPDDLTIAIAEATSQPVHVVADRIENDVHRNADGTPALDARGRTMRVFNKRTLDSLRTDPRIVPILARLTAERAKRLAAEAKAGKGEQSDTLAMFGTGGTPAAAAAN